jgi:hypothetical protein
MSLGTGWVISLFDSLRRPGDIDNSKTKETRIRTHTLRFCVPGLEPGCRNSAAFARTRTILDHILYVMN